jgi:hypothetical protein
MTRACEMSALRQTSSALLLAAHRIKGGVGLETRRKAVQKDSLQGKGAKER